MNILEKIERAFNFFKEHLQTPISRVKEEQEKFPEHSFKSNSTSYYSEIFVAIILYQ